MRTVEEWMDVKMLANQGHSARAIARITGYSRNTVAKLLHQPVVRTKGGYESARLLARLFGLEEPPSA